jgi:hypothetical protein
MLGEVGVILIPISPFLAHFEGVLGRKWVFGSELGGGYLVKMVGNRNLRGGC